MLSSYLIVAAMCAVICAIGYYVAVRWAGQSPRVGLALVAGVVLYASLSTFVQVKVGLGQLTTLLLMNVPALLFLA